MGEGPIFLTWAYEFMRGVYHPPFDMLKICTSAYDIMLKLLHVVRLAFPV